MKQLTLLLYLIVFTSISYSQVSVYETPVSINESGADSHSSAMLDIDADDKGILIPRISTSDINNISTPATGLLVFDSDLAVFKYYDGISWQPIVSSSAGVNGVGDIQVFGSNGIYTVSYTDADKDNTNEIQFISKNGNVISLSAIEGIGGGTVTLDDNDPTNEIQNLNYNYASNILTISNNANTNIIDLSVLANQSEVVEGVNDITVTEDNGVFTVDYEDGDKSDTNEAQAISIDGNEVTLSAINGVGGGTITLTDNNSENEIQDLSFDAASNIINITNNASATDIDLSDLNESVTGMNDITVTETDGVFTVDYLDGDKSDVNEAQALSKFENEIILTMANGAGGGTVILNDDDAGNEIQDLSYDPTTNVLNVTNNDAASDIDLTELEESVTGTNDIAVTEIDGVYTVDYVDGDKSNTNEAQFISKLFNTVTLTAANNVGGGSFNLEDDDPNNEIQDLSYDAASNILMITNNLSASEINLTELEESVEGSNDITVTESGGTYTVDYTDGDKSDVNEAQSLTKNGANINLTMANGAGGGLVSLNDDDAENEIQDLSYDASTNVLKITNNGTASDIDLTELEESVAGANDISVSESNGVYTVDYNDGDKSDTNEAQTLSKSGADISLTMANGSGGGTITLNDDSTTNEIQDLNYNSTTKILSITDNSTATEIDLSVIEDDLGNHTATTDIILSEKHLKLKGASDTKNALRSAGATTMFDGYDPNGVALYGEDGGVLGTTKSQDNIILSWQDNGRVGINTTTPENALDVNGHITLSHSTGDEMVIKNDKTWIHSSGSQDMSYGVDGGDHFIVASKEGSVKGSGIYGDGDHLTLWAPGETLEATSAYIYVVDTDKMDDDNDPYDNGAVAAYLGLDGNWVAASDINRKENISALEGSLAKVLALNGYSYNFKRTEAEKADGTQATKVIGVIAQEVAQVIPEVVDIKDNGEHFVSYTEFIPFLIESIKEQQEQINELRSELQLLKENK